MIPVLFHIGPIPVYSFGAFMALAAVAGGWVAWLELKRYGYDPEISSSLVFAGAIGGLLGARILFIFEEWISFIQHPWDFILTGAGFTWYGGVVGGILAATWVVRREGIPWLKAADICAPALALAYGVGRIGCHVAGDGDWGIETTVPWGVAYTNAIIGWVHPDTGIAYPPGVKVHPTPIYELLESLVIFAVLWSVRKKDYSDGTIFWLYLVLSGVARFVVEFWRINPPIAGGLSEAQWFSLGAVVLGSLLLYLQPGRARAAV
ncbi:MAG TPA: prolipoprotein diacylglyceryl transferase [Candidatus Binatia bacterium]|nr:prolipoprotein diacylglyceryl transferase [Candidatus Binatia bacterium]